MLRLTVMYNDFIQNQHLTLPKLTIRVSTLNDLLPSGQRYFLIHITQPNVFGLSQYLFIT